MASNIMVAISSDFFTSFSKLPRQTQGKVTEFVNKFKNNPLSPGINYEKLLHCPDKKICSVRIDQAYRGIVVREEKTGVYILLWVDHHDKAYEWAMNRRCEVNSTTGALQVFDVKEADTIKTPSSKALFSGISDDSLFKLSVPKAQLSLVRSILNENEFQKAKSSLPADAYENLSWLTEGIPLTEVLDMVKEEQENKTASDSFADALKCPDTLKSFYVVNGEDELYRMMAEPLEKWRIFLHPTQRKIISKDYAGAARVLGGAGTGKTVVAMHRAKELSSKLNDKEQILFTTFTANLASDIKENLRKICTVQEMRNIEVINIDAWVTRYLREEGFEAQIIYNEADIDKLWEDAVALADVELPLPISFFEEEWNRIVIAQEALSIEKYVKASRSGRGTRLDRKKRIQVWKVFESYINLMKERKVRDINTAMYECTKLLSKSAGRPRYSHIIVDEGQDFSDNAYKLLRALAGEPHPNDLFIVGDSHQRIYKNRPVLSKCGINVRGRSSILKINYRTTEEIRKYAFALLDGISFDDLDDSVDLGDKCQSLTHGNKPSINSFNDAASECEFILSEVKKLRDSGVSLNDICIVARTNKLVEDYISAFTAAGIHCFAIKRSRTDDRQFDGLRIATMHRVKGLEFQYVFVVAVNDGKVPLSTAIDTTDEISRQESLTSEKCLLYVALTRAQKGAYITSYGKKSEFLK